MPNRLQYESSPYLLQHAHNPVDWYSWGQEAFGKAEREDKPILVSIGYSTCHWCHVMERESFEDPVVAAFMNQHYVNIKIDREEHPEIDQIYMEAVQLLTGAGGWPLNCFLLPDRRPFFGGTYFPPVSSYNRPSWRDTLHYIAGIFKEKRSMVEGQAERLTSMLKDGDKKWIKDDLVIPNEDSLPSIDWAIIYQKLESQFDRAWGGMGSAPKFPSVPTLQLLLYLDYYKKLDGGFNHLQFTMDKMMAGGIYDVVGGGFARYATDREWRIPHFEKMLYDNAQILDILSSIYKITGNDKYLECAERVVSFLNRELRDSSGLYYAALDADSEGVEGKFYTWTYESLKEIIPVSLQKHFFRFHKIVPDGNWEGVNILYSDGDASSYAEENGLENAIWKKQLNNIYDQLLSVRNTRVRPHLDHKVLLSWNALLVNALLKWREAAPDSSIHNHVGLFLDTLLDAFLNRGYRLYRVATNQSKKLRGNLDDYTYLIEALITAGQVLNDEKYFQIAERLTSVVFEDFTNEESLLFYFASLEDTDIPIRKTEIYDHALPSANAIMCKNLLALGTIVGNLDWVDHAKKMNAAVSDIFLKFPTAMASWSRVGLMMEFPFFEVEVIGTDKLEWEKKLLMRFLPNKVISTKVKPIADTTFQVQNELNQVLICRNQACELPKIDLETAIERIKSIL